MSSLQELTVGFIYLIYDQSIGSTKTRYIKLNTKTHFILSFKWKFDGFFIHFDRGDKKTEGEKKSFLFKVYNKVERY